MGITRSKISNKAYLTNLTYGLDLWPLKATGMKYIINMFTKQAIRP